MVVNKLKLMFFVLMMGLAVWFLVGYFCSSYMVSRRDAPFNIAKDKLNPEDINLKSEDNIVISAWYLKGDSSKAVIILPGIGAHRKSCISRAEFYLSKGYHVLLPDLRATGNSGGEVISFGWNESKDLKACYKFLKRRNINKIAVHGCSLGAATITYSFKEISDYYFVVLESCYDNIDQAFENRVKKFHLPGLAYFPVRFFIEKKIGAKTEELKPEEYIKLCKAPVFIMSGDAEVQVKTSETKKLYQNCASPKKKLYFF